MRITHRLSLLAVAIAAVFASACGSDNPTSPGAKPKSPSPGPSQTLLGSPVTVRTLQRRTPLAAPIVVSKNIGLLGGTISIPAAGLTVVVPPLAVTRNTTFTVTALAGSAVAYEFEPAGARFTLPLVVTQSFAETHTEGLNLSLFQGGYFKSASDIDGRTGTARVSELLNLSVSLAPLIGVFTVTHFSGYLVATGVESRDE
jgi:hypothetical protein